MTEGLAPFLREDAILLEDIIPQLESFVAAGGSIEKACDALVESYVGVPDMLRALVGWVNNYGDGEIALVNAVQRTMQMHEKVLVPRIDSMIASDPQASAIVSKTLSSPRWGNLLLDIASRHRHSIFANHVLRESRFQQAGFTAEHLNSANDLLEIVSQQLELIFSTDQNSGNYDMKSVIHNIALLSTFSEAATLIVLRFLNQLGQSASDMSTKNTYRYISQEVRREIVKFMVSICGESEAISKQWINRLLILSDSSIYEQDIPQVVLDALLDILDSSSRTRVDKNVKIVSEIYGNLLGQPINSRNKRFSSDSIQTIDDPLQKSLLIQVVCHTEVLESLLSLLFSSDGNVSLNEEFSVRKRDCLCMLLAYGRTFILLEHDEIVRRLSNEETIAELCILVARSKRDATHVIRVCEELKPGSIVSKFKGKPIETLLSAVKDPIMAQGILLWAEQRMRGGKDMRSLLVTVTRYLGFMEAIANHHPFLRTKMLAVIKTAYLRDYSDLKSSRVDQLRATMMSSITGMVRFHKGHEIVRSFAESLLSDDNVSEEHIRCFIISLLQTISPPYQPAFSSFLLNLLQNEKVRGATGHHEDSLHLVQEFHRMIESQSLPRS